MADSVELTVIRHFPTAGNANRQYIGWTDEPIEQVNVMPQSDTPHYVYGSDLLRAQQTAKQLYPQSMYVPDVRFRECNFGTYEGKTYAQLEKDRQYRNWIDDPIGVAPPFGETLQQVEQRVMAAFQQLPVGATVVTHGGPIRLLLSRFAPEERAFWSWDVPHGVRYRLHWAEKRAWEEGRRCTSLSEERLMENDNMSRNT